MDTGGEKKRKQNTADTDSICYFQFLTAQDCSYPRTIHIVSFSSPCSYQFCDDLETKTQNKGIQTRRTLLGLNSNLTGN